LKTYNPAESFRRSIGDSIEQHQSEKAHDPFPKTGLVKQYEPFIRDWVANFCKRYPAVRRDDALIEAVKIAVEFEPKFNPETGNDFSTPLRWHLKGLKRILVDDEQNHSKRLIHAKEGEVSEELAKRVMLDDVALAKHERRATEEKLEAIPVNHGTGGNGTRIRLDLNGLVVGFQFFSKVSAVKEARQFGYAREITEQLSADLRTLIGIGGGRPTLSGRMGAVIAHNEQRQHEADQEAENQRNGDYDPVFLESRDTLRPDIQFREPKKRATPKPNVPKPVPISENPDLNGLIGSCASSAKRTGWPCFWVPPKTCDRPWIRGSVPFSIGCSIHETAR